VYPATVLTVFAVIALAELPDKTMIATLLMGSRGSPAWVWLGASLAFVVNVAIAVLAGQLLTRLPHTAIEAVVTVMFLGGAAFLLLVPEKQAEEQGEDEAAAERKVRTWRIALSAFGVIMIAEFGDLTQLLTASFVARTHRPLSVALGATVALVCVAALGAFAGKALLRVLPLARIRRAGGVVLLGFGAYSSYVLLSG